MKAVPKRCPRQGCVQYVPCPTHVTQGRGRGYDAAWDRRVARAKKANPYCTRCGKAPTSDNPLTGDHTIPLSQGGSWNQQPVIMCRRCNSSLGAR